MKSFSTLVLLVLFPFIEILAQRPITVSDDSLNIGKSPLPGLSVTIPEVDYEKTLKIWIKELQSGTKSKVVNENSEITIFGAAIKAISPNPINVYSKLTNLDSVLVLVVSFELKKDQYVERLTTETEHAKAQKYLKDFAKNQYIDLVKEQVDAEDKKLRSIQKELSSLGKEKSRLQKSIESNKTDISKEKENIVIQNNELTTVSAALIEHNKQLSEMTEGPEQKEKMDYIKDLEKKQKKIRNSIESSENKINKCNNDINKATNEIPENEKMQDKVMGQVAEQEAVYQKFADKLAKIKSY